MVKRDIARAPILEAFRQNEGCPMCLLWSNSEVRHLEYAETNELSMNPSFRQKVVDAGGFCNRHMHKLYGIAFSGQTENGLGYAMYARDVITSLEGRIAEAESRILAVEKKGTRRGFMGTGGPAAGNGEAIKVLRRDIRSRTECPVCTWVAESERQSMAMLIQMLHDDPDFVTTFETSGGVCVPHFASALGHLHGKGTENARIARVLLEVERNRLARLGALLGERIRKYGYEYRGEKISREEAGSQGDAAKTIAGREGLDSDLGKA